MLTKFIHTSKTHSHESINCLSTEKKVGICHEENPKAFICYSQIIDYVPKKKRKKIIVFDYIIVDMEAHKKLSPIVTELFKKDNKLNISLVFIWQSYFKVFEDIRLNVTHYFIMEIPNKREIHQVA